MATNTTTIKFVGQFDTSQITKGLQDIKKQITSSNISDELKRQLQDAFSKVEVNLPKLDKFMKKEDFNLKELDQYQKLVQEITKDMTNFSKIANEADFTKSFSEQDTARLKKFDEQIKQVDNRLKATKEEIIKTFTSSDKGKIGGKSNNTLNDFIEQLISVPPDKIEEKLNEVIKEAEVQADQAVDRLQTIFKNKATGHQGGKGFIELLFGENSGVSLKKGKTLGNSKTGEQGAYSAFNEIREQVLKLEKDAGPDKINPILEAYSNFIEKFFEIPKDKQSVLDNLVTPEIVERLRQFKGPDGIEGLKQILGVGNLKLLADGEAEKLRLTQEQAAELKKVIEGLAEKGQITRTEADNLVKSLTGLSGVINDNTNAAKNLENQQKALSATFGSLANRITNSVSALAIFNKSIQIVHKAIASVKELDAAFTQIAIVSGQTNEQAWEMFDSFNSLAKQYSITTKDLAEGAKLFYQQGLNAADTMKMVEASTISAALGEVTMTEAANTLTAAIQGYNESASVAMDYTDKIAMVGAVSAADFNELSAAMEKTASSAYTAGIDFDHLLGYLGKMIEVTREAPANLGTAMKTIIARFEDMKKDPTALLEDGVSANKVEAALKTIDIALRDTTGEFRPLQEVFDELGMKWQSLTRNQQAYIATVAAGSRQQSRFLAMMNNYDRTLDLIAESQDSAGAAAEQYATYQNSIQAATARLTVTWEKFYKKIANSKTIITVINALSDLVEVMNTIGPAASAIGASIGALGLQTIGKAILPEISKRIIDISSAGKGANETLKLAVTGTAQIIKNIGIISIEIVAIVAAITLLGIGIATIIKQEKQLKDLRENPYKQYLNNLAEENKKRKEIIDDLKEESNLIQDNLNIYKKYEDQVILTEEELQEQNDAVDKLKEANEEIIVITDELGRKIISNTNYLEEQNKANKEKIKLLEKEAALAKLNAVTPTVAANYFYGNDTNTYMKDWTVENLQKFGYSEEEAKLLNEYGEFQKNKNKTTGQKNFLFNNLPTQSLSEKILQKYADVTGKKNFGGDLKDFHVLGINGEEILKILESNKLEKIEDLLNQIDEVYTEASPDAKKFFDVIKEEGQLALDAITILNNASKEYAKTIMDIELNSSSMSENVQIDFSNLLNNLGAFNNGEYLKQFEGMSPDEINNRIKEIFSSVETTMSSVSDIGFHELTKQLLDPSLSPNERQKIVNDFKSEFGNIYGEIDKELEQMLNQFVAGSTVDIKKREALSEKLGINTKDLNNLNYSQLKILDGFQIASKKGDKGFDVGKWLLSDANSEQLLEALDNLEQDILKNPTIYRKSQKIMIDFFKNNMGLDDKTAYDTFESMFGNVPEAAAEAAYDTFQSAQNLILTEPDKALTKKQSEAYKELEALLGENLRYYISINEQGEEYLSIAGRIAVFDKASEEYRNSLIAQGQKWIIELEEIDVTNDKISDEQAKQIKNLEQDIKLNDERIKKLDEIRKYNAQITAETANIDRADTYQNNLSGIKKAEDEMKKFNGKMNSDTAKSIIQMNSEYVQYLDKKVEGEDYYYTITAENIELLKKKERERYNEWIRQQQKTLDDQIVLLQAQLDYYTKVAEAEGDISEVTTEEEWKNNEEKTDKILKDAEAALEAKTEGEEDTNQEILNGALTTAERFEQTWSDAYDSLGEKWDALAEAMEAGEPRDGAKKSIMKTDWKPKEQKAEDLKGPEIKKPENNNEENNENDILKDDDDKKERAKEQINRIKDAIDRLKVARDSLVPLGPELEDTTKSGGKTENELKKLTDALKDLGDALEDLDELLKEVNRDLNDINVDYNPFTDLFEAWEKEWDYYYNIKRLIQQIEDQGKYIDSIISADYTSADQKIAAEQAKVGRLLAAMAANDAYIESLRTGMSQTAVELMDEFGEYYKVDPNTGQIYQHDTSLNEINNIINQRRQEIYELQKLQNEKENDLSLENAKLDALEKEKSAYEDILSTVESQLDSLKNDEDIIADVSGLEAEKANIKANITITDESIDVVKDVVRNMEDEIQEIEVDITLKEQSLSKLEDYVDRMEDKVSEYEEYWENLNSTIAEQQELLQSITEIYQNYVDTAISTEQDLYNAIIENYQNEINQKKKQYDELKNLDKDYLASVKDSINEERKAREDANKQKSYQQSLQRAQLLQQDTSGAYRAELAQLNKDIEQQRQDLYDDLVDKQVEALEKEIDKRHELYDKEVAALEERLAYMQENAILLWEMVNNIVAEGAENMMSILENTTAYINSNELAKDKQRKQWEYNVKKTFDGVQNKTIDMLNALVEAGNEYINDKLPEVGTAVDNYTEVYQDAAHVIVNYNELLQNNMWSLFGGTGNEGAFQTILNTFMSNWNSTTNALTGYTESWQAIIEGLRSATEGNIQSLRDMNNQGGSIKELDKALRDSAKELYEDFLNERRRYRDELDGLVDSIRTEITAAIKAAADAIRGAANSLQVNPNKDNGGTTSGNSANTGSNSTASSSGGSGNQKGTLKGWKAYFDNGTGSGPYQQTQLISSKGDLTQEQAYQSWLKTLENKRKQYPGATSWGLTYFKQGGFANFTGPAWVDGTKSQPEAVLNPKQTRLFTSMVSSLERTANNSNINSPLGSSYNIGDINTTIQVDKLDNQTDINRLARQVEDKIVKDIRNRIPVSVTKGV